MCRTAGLVVWVCVLWIPLGMAQTTGTISGVVRDASGGVVPGATVVVKNVETGLTRTLPTDAQGRYQAPNLSVGQYEVQVSLSGFQTAVRSGIGLTVAQEAVVHFTLQVGQVAQTVEITGEAPLVEATNATISGLVDQDTIRDLPLNGRSFDQLMQLEVGVINARQNQGTSGLGGGPKISISGVRPHGNSFLLDGTDVNDSRNAVPGGSSGLTLGVETVREFRVLTNSYSAEYGRASGGVLTAVTRSGTNDVHGTVFEFLRNAKLDATPWEAKARGNGEKPPFKRNQFGFTLGGPIRKNQTFFFGSYEGLRDRLGGTQPITVPTARAKAGIMPLSAAPASLFPRPVADPDTPGEKFIGVAPGVKPWLDLYPLPNTPSPRNDLGNGTGEFTWVTSQPTNQNYFTLRGDHSFSANHSIFGRFTGDRSERVIPQSLPIHTEPNANRNQYLTVQYDSILTATTLNTARFGMNRSHARETQKVAVPAEMTFVPGVPFDEGGQLGISGIAQIGNNLQPRGTNYTLLEGSDDVTLIRGSHTLKTGFIFKKIMDFQEATTARAGRYSLDGLWDALQGQRGDFLVQWPGFPQDRDWRQNLFGAYVQDDFKWKPNLTLNLGVREEFMTSPNEVQGRCANLPDFMQTAPKVGCPLFETFKSNWAPRVGFAWDTASNSRVVLRGGWGLFYDQPFSTYWRVPGRLVPPHTLQITRQPTVFPNAASLLDFTQVPSSAAVALRSLNYTGTAYAMQYNFNIQSELRPGTGVMLGYIGSQSRKLIITGGKNVRQWQILADGGRKYYPPNSPILNPAWLNISVSSTEGNASYSAFVASLNQRFRGGLRLQASYTFGKTISISDTVFGSDFTGDPSGGVTDGHNPGMDRGLAAYGIKHNFVLNYSYDLPFQGQGWAGKLIQGWQLSGIVTRQSGIPLTVTTAFRPGDGLERGGGSSGSPNYRPDLLPGSSNNPISGTSAGCTFVNGIPGPVDPGYATDLAVAARTIAPGRKLGTPDLYFDPCVFSNPALGFYGNLGRHTVIGPGLVNFDFSLVKNTAITEWSSLQFRAEFFNILNHPSFNNPSGSVFDRQRNLTPIRGRIDSANTAPRQVQLGLKLLF